MFAERILHLDMDAFFVEVERRRNPRLAGRQVLVGGAGSRSVVASASYEARARGVHAGMPMVQARRLCPHGVVVPPDHHAYGEASREVFAVLGSFTPLVEPVSVDEGFLDIGGLGLLHPSPRTVGEAVRDAVVGATGLPCSVGIGTSKLVAKMASRQAKPSGIVVVPAGAETAFLHPKPVRDLWGVGEATLARLEELGVVTIGDLAEIPRPTLCRRLGDALGSQLADLARGIDDRPVSTAGPHRSISVEETYEQDLTAGERIRRELLAQSDRVGSRMRRAGVVAGTVVLKVRYGDFTTISRSHTFPAPVSTAHQIYAAVLELLRRTDAGKRPVRLLGVGVEGLVDAGEPRQLDLDERSWEDVERAVDGLRRRFGTEVVERARLLDEQGDLPGPQ